MSYDRLRTRLLAAIAACGLLIVALSFSPWIHFESAVGAVDSPTRVSFDLQGTETSRLRDREVINPNDVKEEDEWCSCRTSVGDGYLTLAFGVVILASMAIGWLGRREGAAGSVVVIAALAGTVLAGYNAIADWGALTWTERSFTEAVDGSATWQLWALVVVSAVAAVLGGVLWMLVSVLDEDGWDDDEEWEEPVEPGPDVWVSGN